MARKKLSSQAAAPAPVKSAHAQPNQQPPPGPVGNTNGLVMPDTAPNTRGSTAPPITPAAAEKGWWQRWGSDVVHTGLDIVGLIPGAGEIADLANAGIYLAEGDKVNAAMSLASAVPGAGMAATGAKWGKKAAGAAAEGAAKATGREAAEQGGKKAAQEAGEQGAKKAAGGGGGKDKGPRKRRPGRRCELVPYGELECPPGQAAHHVVPDFAYRVSKRPGKGAGTAGRAPGAPTLEQGLAICLSKEEHAAAHQSDKRYKGASESARGGKTVGTMTGGQAKTISASNVEKATGGKKGGGCSKQDLLDQLKQQTPDDAVLRGDKDLRKFRRRDGAADRILKPGGDD